MHETCRRTPCDEDLLPVARLPHRPYSQPMRPLRYSINVTVDGCCDHRAMSADDDLHRHAIENIVQADIAETVALQMNVQAVIFDMDGLMLDTEPLYKSAWQRASAELGYELDDATHARLVGRPTADCEVALVDQFGAAFRLDDFRARWPTLWKTAATGGGIRTKPGLFELLTLLAKSALPVAVATSSNADDTTFSLGEAGLLERFAVVVTGDQVARGKPAPDIYLKAARQLRVDPTRCVALEDSEAGVLAATGAGMTTLLIPDSTPPSDVAAQAAFRVLPSLIEARQVMAALIARR
jgi:beta-phosphoglucomutase-like phosphatase (HAD superfamily)